MKNRILILFLLLSSISICAQRIPADTIQFTATKAVAELDPNNRNYCFTLQGDANGTPWKMQMDYYADSLYGTITDTEFRLPKGGGSSTNWIRKNDGSYKTYYGHSLSATVTDNNGTTTIDLSGLYRESKFGDTTWHYVQVHADILPYTAKTTTQIDLGQVAVVPNTFLGYVIMEAENTSYSLAFGVSGISALHAGTFYRSEMIRPDLVSKTTGDTITPIYAQLEVRDSTVSGLYQLRLDIYDADTNLYRVHMHTDAISIRDTVTINCSSATLQDVEAMYGFFQMVGTNNDYQVALAVKPGIIHNSELQIPNDSVDLSYTQVLRNSDNALIRVQQASAVIVVDSTSTIAKQTVYADLIGTNGTLYKVSFPFGGSDLPAATDTTVIECGDQVGRLDYTHGAGFLGLVLGNSEADVHITVYNGLAMSGTFTSTDFVYDEPKAYITTYSAQDSVIRFSDIQAAEMHMDSIGDTVRINLDVVTVANRMYRFHARLLPMQALTGQEVNYTINNSQTDDGVMAAFRMNSQTHTYRLQFQRSDEWDESTGQLAGDNYEIWDFLFAQDSIDGISGTYGYAAGTLQDGRYHTIVERGTEIYLKPMAGTLSLTAGQAVTIPASILGFDYHTHLYTAEAHLAMENGIIYHLTGQNFLLCVDYETESYLELTEGQITALEDLLNKQGIHIQKVLRNGQLIIICDGQEYNAAGMKF